MADVIEAFPRWNLYDKSTDEALATFKLTIGSWRA
jgi:hypothetical protein